MTSRRSRLKAVTNLPVRRKTLISQGNGGDPADNLTPEKAYSCEKADETVGVTNCSQPNYVDVNDINDIQNKTSGNDSTVTESCNVNFQNSESSIKDIANSTVDECNSSEVVENSTELNKTSNVYSHKTEGGSGFRSNKRFKPNLVSSTRERPQVQTQEKAKESDSLKELNCITISDNSFNSNNNNIVEDGFKCYTVLTPQNVTITPLSEYTITPLTPCANTFIDANINEIDPPQEYQEVQIYTEIGSTEIEPTEIYVNNEINENSGSVIEEALQQPVLTNLTNCTSEHDAKGVKYDSINPNLTELKSVQGNFEKKTTGEKRKLSIRNNFNVNDNYGSATPQIRDSYSLESTVASKKHSISALRRRPKYNDFTKKLADAKREFQKKYEKIKPDRSTLKMIDLIFYNPATNPMESKCKFIKKEPGLPSDVLNELLAEEKVDEPDSVDSKSNMSDSCETENMSKMPVPQVKIGLDGEIILDEKSLVIETTDAKKGREELQNSVPVFEDREYKVSYYRGKSKKTKDWADFETKRFYKALNTIGPDFTLMQKYFPNRSRLELKNKFKREERLNRNLIDKALNNPSEFDMTQLEKDLANEGQEEQREPSSRLSKLTKASKKRKRRTSYLSREIIETDDESDDSSQQESLDSTLKGLSDSEKTKKEKEFDFVFQKLLMKESKTAVTVLPEISSSSADTFQYSDHGVT